jgi:hypothetical protein
MDEIALHLLDIVENSINAGAEKVWVTISQRGSWLELTVQDNGSGFDPEILASAADPFITTRRQRSVGLGLGLLLQSARGCGGGVEIDNRKTGGSLVTAHFDVSHIDCPPMGDLASSILILLFTRKSTSFGFELHTDSGEWIFSDVSLRRELCIPDAGMNECLKRIRRFAEERLKQLGFGGYGENETRKRTG